MYLTDSRELSLKVSISTKVTIEFIVLKNSDNLYCPNQRDFFGDNLAVLNSQSTLSVNRINKQSLRSMALAKRFSPSPTNTRGYE